MSIRKLCLTSTILITGLSVSGCANVLDPISTSFNQLTGQNSAAPAAKKKPAVAQKTSKKKVAAVRKKAPVKTPTVAAKLPVPAAKPAQAPKVGRRFTTPALTGLKLRLDDKDPRAETLFHERGANNTHKE